MWVSGSNWSENQLDQLECHKDQVECHKDQGPLLFVLSIKDIDDGTLSTISNFADDTKLCKAVGDNQEADILWEDLRRMFRWSQDWKMLFNLEKCSVVGKRNQELSYGMGGKVLKASEKERDLGVIEYRFLQGDNSTREDQLKQKHTAEMWTSLTEGQEDHYELNIEVGDQRLQRVGA